MLARARSQLPNGALDLTRQLVLFCGAYWLYQLVRGAVDGRAAAALDADHLAGVVERRRGASVDHAAHELVQPVGAAEQHQLAREIERAVGELGAGPGQHE